MLQANIKNKKYIAILFFIVLIVGILQHETVANTKSRTIVIDPGHGGVDSGAYIKKLNEKDINLHIAKILQEMLEEKGYNVVMIRKNDVSLENRFFSKGTRQQRDLYSRCKIIDRSGADLFVSIHADSCPESRSANGSVVYYYPGSKEGKKLANEVQKKLNTFAAVPYKRKKGQAQPQDYYILRNTKTTGILVEAGYLSNSRDVQLLKRDDFRSSVARGICEGIEEYFN